MALPDISTLSEEELQQLVAQAQQRLVDIEGTERINRQQLLDRSAVQTQIDALSTIADAMDAILATENSIINTAPAPHIKDLARAVRRLSNNMRRVLRVEAGLLDSTDVGEPTP